ncbi:MAG TPA: response regulator [Bryobacteraceae bacterium]|jgi:CheY-like chemotaxis protein|nr:response regulator [Bryobacteraceae bacterium]
MPNLEILIVENDPAMARLTLEAFRDAGHTSPIVSLPDGDEALAFLRRTGKYSERPLPNVICLDLHLPKKPGLQILGEIKRDPVLKAIPVIVVSGSDNPKEVREAYELHASCYIRKPDDLEPFMRFIRICFEFWGSVVTFPTIPDTQPI